MEEEVLKYLSDKYTVSQIDEINEQLNDELGKWKTSVHRKLRMENPFFENQNRFADSIESFNRKVFDITSLSNDFNGYSELSKISNCNLDEGFWKKEITKFEAIENLEKGLSTKKSQPASDLKISRKLLLQKWEKSLTEEYSKWELSEIENYRQEILKKLENWLELLQQFQDLMEELSFDTGLLFDLSHGSITLNDINQLKKWAEYITKNEGIKELCDMLGRLRNIEKSTKQEIINVSTHIEETIKDYTSKEEIVGIKIGNELEHVLPQELALLRDEETSILFDKKYVESELMCFDLEGTSQQTIEKDEESFKEVSEDEKMGPIIICVDTSGSMSGSPETIAKSIALYLSSRAKSQKRDCFLINFSTSIETLDLSGKLGVRQLIEFLGRSFHGGTDVAPAIKYAIKKMNEESYKKADLLIVSDFIMASLPNEIEANIGEVKKEGNKFYSLSIGNLFLESRMKALFDGEWVYNPQNTSITQIRNIVNEIDRN
jgi:uncharacterized protein with von Willebrand factor type A (vWA) domain